MGVYNFFYSLDLICQQMNPNISLFLSLSLSLSLFLKVENDSHLKKLWKP